jgi:hypothetical protein
MIDFDAWPLLGFLGSLISTTDKGTDDQVLIQCSFILVVVKCYIFKNTRR